MQWNTTGAANTAHGYGALSRNTTADDNTALGYQAMFQNDTGFSNTAVGYAALHTNTLGSGNVAVGVHALSGNSIGENNVALGWRALANNSGGSGNVAAGFDALIANEEGYSNSALGYEALQLNTEGWGNTGVGKSSLGSNTIGTRNTAAGMSALFRLTTGTRNVAVGSGAGRNITSGSDNIAIGAENSGTSVENGVIRIGSSAYQKKAYMAGIRGVQTGLAAAVPVFIDANGQLGTIKSSGVAKEDVHSMGNVSERLLALRPVTFRYKQADYDGNKPIQYGLIAEEVAQVFPELVVYDQENKPETVSYHLLATLLVNEFQKDHQQLRSQADEIAQLKAQVAQMAEVFRSISANKSLLQ